jgi:hypothetical protein
VASIGIPEEVAAFTVRRDPVGVGTPVKP